LTPAADEVYLPVLDDYFHSSDKLRGLIRWTLDHGYDQLVKVDDDVYVYYDKLLAALPNLTGDYVGSNRGWDIHGDLSCFKTDFIPGFTYILSEKAMKAAINGDSTTWAEDRWLGEVLHKAGIPPTFDDRFYLSRPTRSNQWVSDEFLKELEKPNGYISVHSLSPEQMVKHYAKHYARRKDAAS
jgi:hypothetical protein